MENDQITFSQFRSNLKHYLDRIEAGEVITVRGLNICTTRTHNANKPTTKDNEHVHGYNKEDRANALYYGGMIEDIKNSIDSAKYSA